MSNTIVLKPTLVIASGMAGAGKTTIFQELARRIANGVYLPRDPIMWGTLNVKPDGSLPPIFPGLEEDRKSKTEPGDLILANTSSGPRIEVCIRQGFAVRL